MTTVTTYRSLLKAAWLLGLLVSLPFYSIAKGNRIVVDLEGKGDFKTIQEAVNSVENNGGKEPVVIYIKKGVYKEKIFIEKNNITLQGEGRDKTTLSASIARDEFRCDHADDWGVATLNINGNDITLKDLTIENRYGMDWTADRVIACASDTVKHERKIGKTGHQMAVRTDKATRLKALNCHFNSLGGDTVSPWNVQDGMFYFKDCVIEGAVDLYCPRGWAYAINCKFIAHSGDACIWHDGSKIEDSKTVLKDCIFEGYDGFKLGRYHRDAQFYLINCRFDANMADKAIFRVPTTNTILWGHRVYYYNCHKEGGDYTWFANNLNTAPGNPDVKNINAKWVFNGKWPVE